MNVIEAARRRFGVQSQDRIAASHKTHNDDNGAHPNIAKLLKDTTALLNQHALPTMGAWHAELVMEEAREFLTKPPVNFVRSGETVRSDRLSLERLGETFFVQCCPSSLNAMSARAFFEEVLRYAGYTAYVRQLAAAYDLDREMMDLLICANMRTRGIIGAITDAIMSENRLTWNAEHGEDLWYLVPDKSAPRIITDLTVVDLPLVTIAGIRVDPFVGLACNGDLYAAIVKRIGSFRNEHQIAELYTGSGLPTSPTPS